MLSIVMPTNYRIRLKSSELFAKYAGGRKMHAISLAQGISYPTVMKYATSDDYVDKISLESLVSFMIGMGLSVEDIAQMRIGEVISIEAQDE
jgi:hypothetical protein